MGRTFTIAIGGVIGAAGVALTVAVPQPLPAAAGVLLLGLGLAPAFPVIYGTVGQRHRAEAGKAIAAVTTVGYLGSVAGPPAIGGLAEFAGLRVSFILLGLAALMMALLAKKLKPAVPRA